MTRLDLAQQRPLARLARVQGGSRRRAVRTARMEATPGWRQREVRRRAGDADERQDRPGQGRERAHQPRRVRVQRAPEEHVGRRRLDDLAGVHDRDAVAELDEQREVVGDEQHREAEPLLERLELLQDLALDDDVERRRRLVHHDQLGLERERHRDHDALAHAARQLVRVASGRGPCRSRPSRAGLRRARARPRGGCGRAPGTCRRTGRPRA